MSGEVGQIDEYAIVALLRRYTELNDAGRYEEVAALFVEDARLIRPSAPHHPLQGRAAILEAFLSRPKGATRRHLVANPTVTLRDTSTATARSYSVLIEDAGNSQGHISLGEFKDELISIGADWKFKSRCGYTIIAPVPCPLPTLPPNGAERRCT